MYCNAGHAMEETSCMDGAYAQGGWWCDLCGGGCGVGFGKRWCCKLCTVDYCFSCRKSANEAAGGAVSGGGSGDSGGGRGAGMAALNTESKSAFPDPVASQPRQQPVYGIASYSSLIHRTNNGRIMRRGRTPLLDARRCLKGN